MSEFLEKADISLSIGSDFKSSFIYFLMQGNKVVYVGQTTKGLARPFTHKNKVYDNIQIIFCDKADLDLLETEYIIKYKPIYNKAIQTHNSMSLRTAWIKFRQCSNTDIFYEEFKEVCEYFEIVTYRANSGKERILIKDFTKLLNLYRGSDLHEIYHNGV